MFALATSTSMAATSVFDDNEISNIITKDKMAAEALSMMEKHQPKPITVLPVIDVEKNEPVGIVHLTDLLRQGVV